MPQAIRERVLLWVGCIAGALEEREYQTKLASAVFTNISIEPTRIYRAEDAHSFLANQGFNIDDVASEVDGKFMSAFVRATKPAACCGPTCCS